MNRFRWSASTGVAITLKWLLGVGLTSAALWSAWVAPDWTDFPEAWQRTQLVFFAALVIGMVEQEGWLWLERRVRVSALIVRLLVVPLVCTVLAALLPKDLPGYGFVLVDCFVLNLLLAFIGLLLKDRRRASIINLGVSMVSVVVTLVMLEVVVAPTAYQMLTSSAARAAQPTVATQIPPTSAPTNSTPPPTPEATQTVPQPSPTPPPVAQTEIVGQAGPGPQWGPLTGWGTNTNTTVHSWMDGVYDVTVQYNSLGFRGPEILYDKPADVYRILLIGDSYVEALQIQYEATVYAQLGALLKDARTPDGKRIEVFGMGATGWGTLQEYLYYHHEGYKFQPDVIIDFFVINDVADNHPAHFYNYRNLDFAIKGDSVRALKTDEQGLAVAQSALQVNPGKRWLDALPSFVQNTALAGLVRLLVDPPRLVVPLQGELTRVHPQNYIYVAKPDIDGYSEGWLRTKRAYEIWANEAQANGGQLMVLPVDISLDKITELSTYFADQTAGWVWDADLPTKKLAAILKPLNVPLIPTRDYYQAYGDKVGKRPFDALFITEDWHWNAAGHEVTAELLAETLKTLGLVTG